ncbi:MAG TPA: phosphoenolpyruvate--protein phosphotransferase [Candidatus Eubacterium faecipullorum]|uniref:Phosphoenolpyruvate-protein phosphotransferase n=1 Tax=Candidatus Eubacterium faecipullorum TaxID=2838571 RepID=A0A9D1RC57_9FIRM|nr:phosphoenolpyruvate--protein phosphotransferase [Candidatus Eubacterium faecipullorum]
MDNTKTYSGVAVSEGYGIGKAVVIKEARPDYSGVAFSTAEKECARLDSAVAEYTAQTKALIEALKKEAGEKNAQILEGHLVMLADPFMIGQMKENINAASVPAEKAVDEVCSMFCAMFSAAEDELTRQRGTDVNDIKNSLLKILLGIEEVDISRVPAGSVLITSDFTPSMTSKINPQNVEAIIGEVGGVTSHSAIIARAMGIPCVLGVADADHIFAPGEELIVDALKGVVIASPSAGDVQKYTALKEQEQQERLLLKEYINKPTVTKSGVKKAVYANIAKAQDVHSAVVNGAEGIGLFRTEFLYMDREDAPSEEEQFEAYSAVAKAMGGREVIIRTLDVGGDKHIPYLQIEKEENPFMGLRAIRYCLKDTALFKTQLKALLRAACFGNIKIMLPLVCTVEEVQSAKALLLECMQELDAQGTEYKKDIKLGIMMETPAAVFVADELAAESDFFSIGTNDLTGYTMAADRGNREVSYLYDSNNPAVLKAIQRIIESAKKAGIPVGMCGEAAADRNMIPKLIEWGLDEFSVSSSAILKTRKAICTCE